MCVCVCVHVCACLMEETNANTKNGKVLDNKAKYVSQ